MGLLSLIRLNRKSELGRSDLGEVDCICRIGHVAFAHHATLVLHTAVHQFIKFALNWFRISAHFAA